ncbi:MAG: hypothetical protein HY901_21120, partial [Deltaproteobacteria bacterium]|nr:hypothetical protein [Deltaproteobacteria bacterium]
MEPLRVNPGGQLAADQIVGREREIERFWQVLERQGLVLAAERRIGKTSIVTKMRAEPKDGFLPIYQDLEAVHSLPELVRSVYAAADAHFARVSWLKSRLAQWSHLLPTKIANIELPSARENWKPLLEQAFADVLESTPTEVKVVFMWDEFPLMLFNLIQRGGPDSAIQVLDLLRSLRQRHSARLRLLFTGSVGLHLVLKGLRASGNANNPVNDMCPETVGPLADVDAHSLAERLLLGLRQPCAERNEIARRIVEHVGGFPFFIHKLVDKLAGAGRELRPPLVAACVEDLLFSDLDALDLRHWPERLELYYSPQDSTLARAILRAVAHSDDGLRFAELANLVRHESPGVS